MTNTDVAKAEVLSAKLDALTAKLETVETKIGASDKPKVAWYTIFTQVLGIPAVVVLMFLQLNQGKQATADTTKSEAETAKAKTEELKARAELEVILNNLQKSREAGIPQFEKQVKAVLPRLDSAIATLNIQNQRRSALIATSQETLLSRYLVAWVFVFAVGVVLDLLAAILNASIIIPLSAFNSLKRRDTPISIRLSRIVQPSAIVLTQIPTIVRISVHITLLFAILAPLFDQYAQAHGGPSFAEVFAHLRHLNFTGAIQSVRRVLMPSAGAI